jgi:TRAP-type C4-dicarboxylate transport system substrate-binding protein
MIHIYNYLYILIVALVFIVIGNPAYSASTTLKLGHDNSVRLPIAEGVVEFAKLIKKNSRGRYSINIFPEGQLGSQVDLLKSVQMGSLDFALVTPSVLAREIKEIRFLEMPFIFPTYEDADKFIKSNADLPPEVTPVFKLYFGLLLSPIQSVSTKRQSLHKGHTASPQEQVVCSSKSYGA